MYTENEVLKTGKIIARNKNPKDGHFYLMPNNRIYRACEETNWTVFPICTQYNIDDMIRRGVTLPA